jgi:hypothetical protein
VKHRLILAGLALTAVIVGMTGGVGRVGAAGTCVVAPTVRDVNVSQGVGGANAAGYSPLVRGKDTLVRYYLSNPSCSSSQLQILDASVTATIKNSANATVGTVGPIATVTRYAADVNGNFPVISPYSTAPIATDTTSDPKFVVPGYQLVSSDDNPFTVTFSVSGHFRVAATGASTAFGGTTTFQTTSNFDRKTRALRVLLVKMGDPNGIPAGGTCPSGVTCTTYGATQHPEFSNAAISATQNAFAAFSRVAPVPGAPSATGSPTGDLTGTSGGIRYTFNVASACSVGTITCGMVNLAALTDANGNALLSTAHNFCGGGGNFTAIQPQLTAMLNAWNAANPNATADRVLGVVDSTVADGPNNGCAGGMAAFGSTQAWIRVDPTAINTGAILAMELGHTLGVVPSTRSRTGSLYHSRFTESDQYVDSKGNAVDPNRAYNDQSRSYLPSDRTVMYASDGNWTTDNVNYEALDYGVVRCMLGGSTTADCATSGTVGTGTGTAVGSHFSIAGSLASNTATTADVTQSYYSLNSVFPTPDPSVVSNYHLVQRRANGSIVRNDPLPVQCDTSDHDSSDEGGGLPGTIENPACYFAMSADFDATLVNQIELWRGAPPAGACTAAGTTVSGATCLYVRHQNPAPTTTADPTSGGGSSQNYTHSTALYDQAPAISPNGDWVAWVNENESVVLDSRGATNPETGPSPTAVGVPNPTGDEFPTERDPAWSPKGDKLAYVLDGDVYVADFSPSGTTPGFAASPPTLVYDASAAADGVAFHLTWNHAGTQVAFDNGGNVYAVPADGSGAAYPTTIVTNGIDPSWSQTPGDNRIAFERLVQVPCGPECITNSKQIWVAIPGDDASPTEFVEEGIDPSWGPDGRIAFASSGSLCSPNDPECLDAPLGIHSMVVDANGHAKLGTDVLLVEAGDGFTEAPSYTGSDLAWIGPDSANLEDVFVKSLATNGVDVTFNAPAGVDPSLYRLSLFYLCNGVNYPVTLNLVGDVSGSTATFHPQFDASFACAGGTLVLKGNDGFSEFDVPLSSPVVLSKDDQSPVVTINQPTANKTFLQFSGIPLNVSAKDAEDGELHGSSIAMKVSGPGLPAGGVAVGTGNAIDLPNGPLPFNDAGGHGWRLGTYTLTATATDSSGNTESATRDYVVVADQNDDGLADSVETGCGISTTDPAAAFGDKDGDGIPNVDDPHPCVADAKDDTTKPTLTVTHTPANNANGQVTSVPTINVNASDDGGLRAVSCTLDGGPVDLSPSGDAVWAKQSYAGSFQVTSYGKHQISCTATDEAYNSTTATDFVWVVYQFSGFLQPVDNPPTVNMGLAGKTYPVKWQLTGTNGATVADLSVVVDENGNPTANLAYKQVTCGAFGTDPADTLETVATGSSVLRINSNQYVYNWQTPPTKNACYVLYLRLNDGTVYTANFQLK